MKFAKEIEQELVPEWRIKYLNYKTGKKYVKAVARAISRANTTPVLRKTGDTLPPRTTPTALAAGSPFSASKKYPSANVGGAEEETSLRSSPAPIGRSKRAASSTRLHPTESNERQSLSQSLQTSPHYGSIGGLGGPGPAPRGRTSSIATDGVHGGFELPDPAMRIPSNTSDKLAVHVEPPAGTALKSATPWLLKDSHQLPMKRSASFAPGQGRRTLPTRTPTFASGADNNNGSNNYSATTPRQRLQRIFSVSPAIMRGQQDTGNNKNSFDMRMLDEVRERELDFFRFLDSELDKVETFYKLKEDQASQRLVLLRDQLHEMRNRRIHEIQVARRKRSQTEVMEMMISPGGSGDEGDEGGSGGSGGSSENDETNGNGHSAAAHGSDDHPENGGENGKGWMPQDWVGPLKAKLFKPGPNSKALQKMPQTPVMSGHGSQPVDGHRDYTRRPGDHDIPYRTAKHKLKLALQEFYRGLELLKSYALLNRTAFRKLNKKYDKAVNARPPYRYMNEKVNRSWFVNSTMVDELIVAVEDLYARYFERGNHKIAAGKLRALTKRAGDESASAFRNGLMIGIGAVFAIQGLVRGSELLLHDPDWLVRQQTSYVLQIYGGYFLMIYLFVLFCLDCRVWSLNKINYPFIFEFDPRSHLDWRQLSQFPSFFILLFGLFFWLNFSDATNPALFLYYPVILIGISVLILFLPAPTLWHRSRKWFLYSHWRLFFAGLYPVEFRDFFLGDIYCSLTYATSNVELFFCIYANHWNNPPQCNSGHSRLLGFFSALPPIWRALQCIRRYKDTRNIFPHLVNCGKYGMTIMSAVCLSLYRIHGSHTNLALFITFSVLNSIYTSIWDLFMDFSLLQTGSSHFLLRDILAVKRRWVYYTIMTIDPILRFSWIFYAIFTHDAQHSTIASFMVAFGEVTRRGMWALLRVENEHCANVSQYKASRDVPLPYHLHETNPLLSSQEPSPVMAGEGNSNGKTADGTPVSAAAAAAAGTAGTPKGRTSNSKSVTGVDGPPSAGGLAKNSPSSTRLQQQRTASTVGSSSGVATAGAGTWAEDESGEAGGASGTVRQRRAGTFGKSIAVIMAEAHKQDFEKKRKPAGAAGGADSSPGGDGSSDEGDNDDDDDAEDVEEAYMEGAEAAAVAAATAEFQKQQQQK